jgi:flagellar protein FliJ
MANSFRFRLDSVLRLRERDRDMAAESLRQALEAKQILEDQITERRQERDQQNSLRLAGKHQQFEPQRMLEAQRYQMFLDSQVAALQEQVGLIEQECQRRRATLVKCEQAVRALEKLRENQRIQWQAVEDTRAQNALDQWSGFRYWSSNVEN